MLWQDLQSNALTGPDFLVTVVLHQCNSIDFNGVISDLHQYEGRRPTLSSTDRPDEQSSDMKTDFPKISRDVWIWDFVLAIREIRAVAHEVWLCLQTSPKFGGTQPCIFVWANF